MKLKVGLDRTPNTLHAGLLLAEVKGYFKDHDLEVEMLSPAEDHYAVTPAKKLAQKQVHLAIGPSENVISYNTLGDKSASLVAIAAMLQQDTGAITTLKDSGVERPSQLDGKTIGSYGARFENDIVRQLIIQDGGRGNFIVKKPEKLEMWHSLINRTIDAAWIFLPWEGVKAEYEENVKLNTFQLRDFNIPYGYSPLLITHQDFIQDENQALKAFLIATERGWRDVYDNPEKAAKLLSEHTKYPDFREKAIVRKSLEMIAPALFNDNDQWGFMEGYHWIDFVDWMIKCQILKDSDGVPMNHGQIDTSMLYTNEFFK